MEDVDNKDEILFLFLYLGMVPRNSTPGGFAYIWQSKWVGIIAIKNERTQIHFLSDVLIAVASLDLKVPVGEFTQRRRRRLRKRHLMDFIKVQKKKRKLLSFVPVLDKTWN